MKRIVLTATFVVLSACTSNDDAQTAQEPVAPTSEAVPAEGDQTVEKSVSPGADTNAPAPSEAAPANEPAAEPVEHTASEATPAAAAPAPSGEFYVAVSHLNVRSGPGMAHEVVNVLPFNSAVPNLGIENMIWVKIAEGQYISRKYLSEEKGSQPIQAAPSPQPEAAPAEAAAPTATDAPEQPAATEAEAEEAPAEGDL